MEDKEKAYNTVALKYYELQELKNIKQDLIEMEQDTKAKLIIKTLHSEYTGHVFGGSEPAYKIKKKKINIVPKLLIQIIDLLIENKQEYLDKAIDLTLVLNERSNTDEH